MCTLPLVAKAYTTLDSDGNGTASTGPQSFREQWGNLTPGTGFTVVSASALDGSAFSWVVI